ncbi:MAG: methyl-accepting chemotaxis protein [Actinomycetota bacterium]
MKISVRMRLLVSFGAQLALMVAVVSAAVMGAARLKNNMNTFEDQYVAGLSQTTVLAESTSEVYGLSLQSTFSPTPAEASELATARQEAEKEIASSFAALKDIAAKAGGSLAADLDTYQRRWAEYLAADDLLGEAVSSGDQQAVVVAAGGLEQAFAPARTALDKLITDFQQGAAAAVRENRGTFGDLVRWITIFSVIFLGVGLASAIFSFILVAKLADRVKDGAQSIGAAASQILAAATEHTASASEQSAALSQTSATVDQVRVTSEQASQRAQDVAKQAQTSVQVAEDGVKVVHEIVTGMQGIREKVEAITEDILALSERTSQISEITSTVNDLADQSNMLALNATIEAAKAGEQGKGFAVVATEVKNLADQSKQATAEVQAILSEIQKGTNAAVLATEQGTKVVEDGVALTGKAGDVIRSLGDTVRDTARAASQIAAAAREQQVGMDQVSQAMRDVSQMTNQFVSGAQQSQSAAESLNELAGHLEQLTATY